MEDWFIVWIGLEINMIRFIILIYKRYRLDSIESCLRYFFVQSLGSAMFIGIFYMGRGFMRELVILVLGYRLGAAPFYFWFPSVCKGIRWIRCFVLISFQKIIPLILIVMCIRYIVWFLIMLRLVIGAFGSFNQSNIKQLMAYSSIHHLGWIIMCVVYNDNIWILYLIVYIFIIIRIIIVLSRSEIIYIISIIGGRIRMWFIINILSLGGMPPLIGFFLKWIVFVYVLSINYVYIIYIVIISVLMFYVYLRLIYDMLIYFGEVHSHFSYNLNVYAVNFDFLGIIGLLLGVRLILIILI